MTVQQLNIQRRTLLKLFRIPENAWNQRSRRSETAVGFGLHKSVHAGEYGEIDALAVGLMMLVAHHGGFDLKDASALVRNHWLDWLRGIAASERSTFKSYAEDINFVVASDDRKTKFLVEVGPWAKSIEKLNKADPNLVPFAVPLSLLIMRVRKGAEEIKLKLPEYFCPGKPDSAAFKRWLEQVEAYRALALKPRVTLEAAG